MKHALGLIGLALLGAGAYADDLQPTKLDRLGSCRSDVQRLCANVEPGGGRIVACLRKNRDNVSADCKAKVEAMAEKRRPSNGPSSEPLGNGKR
ncbi:MAG TPA: cysteine rich repeat-containing protein [Burkholderiaceae bacterium]